MSFITSPGVIVPPLTAGGVAYGTGGQAKVTSAGTAGLFLQSTGAGVPVWAAGGLTLGTPVTSTSGVSIDFIGISTNTKRITVSFAGVSTTGTSSILFQLGDSGGIESTGYDSYGTKGFVFLASTAGFVLFSSSAAQILTGRIVITLIDSSTNKFVVDGVFLAGTSFDNFSSTGFKSLSDQVTQLRITTVGGTDTFDAGQINITME